MAVEGPLTAGGLATFSRGTRTLGTAAAADLAVSGLLSAPDVTATRLNVTALLTSLGSASLGSGAGTALVVSGPATFNAEILAAGGEPGGAQGVGRTDGAEGRTHAQPGWRPVQAAQYGAPHGNSVRRRRATALPTLARRRHHHRQAQRAEPGGGWCRVRQGRSRCNNQALHIGALECAPARKRIQLARRARAHKTQTCPLSQCSHMLAVGGNLTVAKSTVLGAAPSAVLVVKGTAQLGAATVLGMLDAGAANFSSAAVGRLEAGAANISAADVSRLTATAVAASSINVTGAARCEPEVLNGGCLACSAAASCWTARTS